MNRRDPQRRSWLQRLAAAMAAWLLAPALRRRARRQALLQEQLAALLRPLVERQAADSGLAVLEGAMALALADAHFADDEWDLFTSGLALLNLQDQQHSDLSLHGAVDLPWVCRTLAALADPAQRLAVARFYRLLIDADGAAAPAEQRLLEQLLQALAVDSVALQSGGAVAMVQRPPGPIERLRGRLAAPLERLAAAPGRERGR